MTGADRSDVVGLIPDRVEDGLELLEGGLVAADPQREPSRLRPARPAAHRRVEHVDAARLEDRVETTDDGGRVGRQVEVRLAGREAGQQTAALVERHRLDLGRPGQRGEDDVDRLGHRPRRVGPAGAVLDVRLGGILADVVHDQLVAGLLQIGRHVTAHGAEPDESDLHDLASSKTLRAMRPAVMAAGQPA